MGLPRRQDGVPQQGTQHVRRKDNSHSRRQGLPLLRSEGPGSGVALSLPPLRRQCGDIDIWLSGTRRDIVALAREACPGADVCYHHADWLNSEGISVELHIRPSWLCSPLRNRRLQSFFRGHHSFGGVNTPLGFCVPSLEFNSVFILVHIFRHLFYGGVGLRQLLDYYYVVRSLHGSMADVKGKGVLADTRHHLRRLGLYKFARAVMYVLHEVFALPEDMMIVPMDTGEGVFLLGEIMSADNFGRHDVRNRARPGEGRPARFARHIRRNLRFLRHYPEETLSFPFWTVWHWCWRKKNGYV